MKILQLNVVAVVEDIIFDNETGEAQIIQEQRTARSLEEAMKWIKGIQDGQSSTKEPTMSGHQDMQQQ